MFSFFGGCDEYPKAQVQAGVPQIPIGAVQGEVIPPTAQVSLQGCDQVNPFAISRGEVPITLHTAEDGVYSDGVWKHIQTKFRRSTLWPVRLIIGPHPFVAALPLSMFMDIVCLQMARNPPSVSLSIGASVNVTYYPVFSTVTDLMECAEKLKRSGAGDAYVVSEAFGFDRLREFVSMTCGCNRNGPLFLAQMEQHLGKARLALYPMAAFLIPSILRDPMSWVEQDKRRLLAAGHRWNYINEDWTACHGGRIGM